MSTEREAPPGRVADFWTSLVLLVLAAAMLGGALQFPLRGTYAGVRNAWYVSPALFPLIVAGCLAILAAILLASALRAGAARSALARTGGKAGGRDALLVAGLIAAFVVILVPRVDFVVAAALFLFAFTAAFHLRQPTAARAVLGLYLAVLVAVTAMALLGLTPAPRSAAAFAVDLAVLGVLGLAILLGVRQAGDRQQRRRLRHCIGVALVTPLVLTMTFKFFLLVPMPREGALVVALDTVRYALRGAL